MNHIHLPRSLYIPLFILVACPFIFGTLRSFTPAHAAPVLEDLTNKADQPSARINVTPTYTSIANTPNLGPTPTSTPLPPCILPPTDDATSMPTPAPTPSPTATPYPILESAYADTVIITVMAILMVVVILVGMAWGIRSQRKKKEPK